MPSGRFRDGSMTMPHAAPPGTVIFLHSGGMSSRQWRRFAEELRPTHPVLTPDFLGCGDNPPWPPNRAFDFSEDADAIEQLVRSLESPVHLVGHSYGGLIALTVAKRLPERVRSLAVYDPVAFGVLYTPEDAVGLANLAEASRNTAFLDERTGGSAAWYELFIDYWNGPGAWRTLPSATQEAFLRVGRKVFYEVLSLSADRTPASAYATITAPTLLLGGGASPAAALRVVSILGQALPNATVKVFEGAGHMGPLTHGPIVNEAIQNHIETAT